MSDSKEYSIKLSVEDLKALVHSRRDHAIGSIFSLNRMTFPDNGWTLMFDLNGIRRSFHGMSERAVLEKALDIYIEPKQSRCRLSG